MTGVGGTGGIAWTTGTGLTGLSIFLRDLSFLLDFFTLWGRVSEWLREDEGEG